MHGGATFADVLAAELGARAEVPPARHQWSNRPITPPLFIFETTGYAGGPQVRPASYDPPSSEPVDESPSPRVEAAAILLAPHEQEALAALNALGAGLDDRLSSTDLRSAFRRLAHRYHPDRHPGSSRAEQDRLSRRFAEMTDHYRLLTAALNTRATCH